MRHIKYAPKLSMIQEDLTSNSVPYDKHQPIPATIRRSRKTLSLRRHQSWASLSAAPSVLLAPSAPMVPTESPPQRQRDPQEKPSSKGPSLPVTSTSLPEAPQTTTPSSATPPPSSSTTASTLVITPEQQHGPTENASVQLRPLLRARSEPALLVANRGGRATTTYATDMSWTTPTTGKYGRSPLHEAVRRGDLAGVRGLLLRHPELLRQTDFRGNQPLHYAAHGGTRHTEAITYCLLKAGAFVNAVNVRQQTPLLIHVISTETDDDRLVRMLLQHNASPGVKVRDSMLLPEFAEVQGLTAIARALKEFM